MNKQVEMENIFASYEWMFEDLLKKMDTTARKMFKEMNMFGVPSHMYEPFSQAKVGQLITKIDPKEVSE